MGSDGSQLGIMPSAKAMEIAYESNLDLVKVAPRAKPPVCKVMDYGKYRYEQAKKEKEARKRQHVFEIKEVRLSLNIEEHDFNTKLRNALRFINNGDKVKVSIRLRGRERGNARQGFDIMDQFAKDCEDVAFIEKRAKLEGANILMFLAPISSK